MRVKIGDVWYDTKDQPICIQFNEAEQKQISDMDRSVAKKGKYAIFDCEEVKDWTTEQMHDWMQG